MLLRQLLVSGTIGLIAVVRVAGAQTATQVVRFQVNAVSRLAVSGTPAALVISSATAGSAPTSATSGGSTYAITTNEANQKITASIDQPMPSGATLNVTLAPPPGAASAGFVPLGTAGADVVTGISGTTASSLPITYRLDATPTVQMSAAATRTVTLTIVAGT